MSTDGAGPYQLVLHYLHRADLLSRRVADQQLGQQVGTGRAMFLVLDMLEYSGPGGVTQQAIADHLGLTKAAVSRHIATARARGWLHASPSAASRRQNSVTLTTAGRELVKQARRHRAESERQVTGALGAAELHRAARILEELCTLLEQRLRG